MTYAIVIATVLPLLAYVIVGLSRRSQATTLADYFVYSQRVSVQDYANTSVGYALQMAAMFLFTYWGVVYGLGALWTPVFWFLGFFVLYLLLPRFIPYHEQPGAVTLHQYLATRFGGGKVLRTTAAAGTVIGLWGTMMVEIDYTLIVYAPVISHPIGTYFLGAGFLLFGVIYVIKNGYKAEVNTERVQVPVAYLGLIIVLISTLPMVWIHGGSKPYRIVACLLFVAFLVMLVAKLVQGWSWRRPSEDKQIIIPILGMIGLAIVHIWIRNSPAQFVAGTASTVLDVPFEIQMKAQGYLALLSLLVANVLWMPVDLSTWQRVASVEGQRDEVLKRLRRGTLRVMLESPASWCLGVALGLIVQAGGFLPPNTDASEALSVFATGLLRGTAAPYLGWAAAWLYPVFIVGCVAVMLSTVDSLISAIAFTAYKDLPPYLEGENLWPAQKWTIGIMAAGLGIYPLLRKGLDANLPTFLYSAYSAQLSLIVVCMLALLGRRLEKRAALASILSGFAGTGVSFLLAIRIPEMAEVAVLPPIFAVCGAVIGYVLFFKRDGWGLAEEVGR